MVLLEAVLMVFACLVLIVVVCSLLGGSHIEKPLPVTSMRLEIIRGIEASRLNLF